MNNDPQAKTWIVLPAYNEEQALPPLFESLIEHLHNSGTALCIVVVDDGSEDRTSQIAAGYSARVPLLLLRDETNRGLAETLRRGLIEVTKHATPADVIITMDADNTHPADLALEMAKRIHNGDDVVIASRYRLGSRVVGVSVSRRILSAGASWLCRILFPMRGVRDYTSGYRAYRADVLKSLIERYREQFISESGFSCMLDILLRLRESDLRFTEVPLVLRYDRKPGGSKMPVTQTVFATLKILLRRRWPHS